MIGWSMRAGLSYSRFVIAQRLQRDLDGWSVVSGESLSRYITLTNSPTALGVPPIPGSTVIEIVPQSGVVMSWLVQGPVDGQRDSAMISLAMEPMPVGAGWQDRLINTVLGMAKERV